MNVNYPKGMNSRVEAYLKSQSASRTHGVMESKVNQVIKERKTNSPELDCNSTEMKSDAEEMYKDKQVLKIQWKNINVSEKESESFRQELGSEMMPGEVGKFLYGGDFVLGLGYGDMSHKLLYKGEIDGIKIYTSENYLLVNGTLDNDKTSLNDWIAKRSRLGFPNLSENDLKDAQKCVMKIAKMAASGINKLPPYEGMIYRGDSMTNEELDGWRTGDKIMITTKFMSCTTKVSLGETYAKNSAKSYINDTNKEYRPVVYAFHSQSSKDITKYSVHPAEDERIYTPGQAFRAFKVDEETIPGLAIIFLEELK